MAYSFRWLLRGLSLKLAAGRIEKLRRAFGLVATGCLSTTHRARKAGQRRSGCPSHAHCR